MDKVEKAIARLQEAAFYSERLYNGAPLVITTSGGKDSDICLELARRADINYEVMHNHTTIDAQTKFLLSAIQTTASVILR